MNRILPLLSFSFALSLSLLTGCSSTSPAPEAFHASREIQATPDTVLRALETALADEGHKTLFVVPNRHQVGFEWSGSGGDDVRTRSLVDVEASGADSLLRLSTSGYLPRSGGLSLGVDLGREWAVRYDPSGEERLLDRVEREAEAGQ